MKYDIYIILFIFLLLLEISLDEHFYTCKNPLSTFLIISHHIISCIIFFPFLHGMYKLHLFIITVIILYWVLINQCIITTWTNISCDLDYKDAQFINFHYHLNTLFGIGNADKEATKKTLIVILCISVIYDLYKLNIFN